MTAAEKKLRAKPWLWASDRVRVSYRAAGAWFVVEIFDLTGSRCISTEYYPTFAKLPKTVKRALAARMEAQP